MTARIERKKRKITEIVGKDRPQRIRIITDKVNTNEETSISHYELKVTTTTTTDIMERFTEKSELLTIVIICDGMYIFQYNSVTRFQSMQWKDLHICKNEINAMSKSEVKAMLL